MKTLLITFLLILNIFANNLYSQWIFINPNTQSILKRIEFANRNTGWAVGSNGAIVKTTNGGMNWIIQTSNTQNYLRGLSVVDTNIVVAVGFDNTLIKTTNGGLNWNVMLFDPLWDRSFQACYFINSNTGWIVSSPMAVFKTTNGGLTFDSSYIDGSFNYAIHFRNENEGLVCGESAQMYRTTNGGKNWIKIIMPLGNQAPNFNDFSFINSETGFVMGETNTKLFRTTNFGISWDSVARLAFYPQNDLIYTLCFINEYTGYCGGAFNKLYKTINGGYNWTEQNISQFGQGFNGDILFFNDKTGFVVGANGKILYTETGGDPSLIINGNDISIKLYRLNQNFPNPFNSTTRISYYISKSSNISLKVYDIKGHLIETLFNGFQKTGEYAVIYNASFLSSGIYFYVLETDKYKEVRKMILLK